MRLFEIPMMIREAFEAITLDEETGEIIGNDAFESIVMDAENKCLSTAKYLKELKYEADAIRNEERTLAARRKALESKHEYLKSMLKQGMESIGAYKMNDSQVSISFRNNPASAVIECDVDSLPDEFKKISIEANKSAIRDALKAGAIIDGCHLQQTQSIIIK